MDEAVAAWVVSLKGNWWEVYGDLALNALEEQVSISNQNVLQAEAQYRQAKTQVRVARSALFPTVSTGPAVTVSRSGGITGQTSSAGQTSGTRTLFDLPFRCFLGTRSVGQPPPR